MLPQFPQFKKLELSDRADIENITKRYPPYSDFNFVSMWSWDIKDETLISELHGNLVARLTDYTTGEPVYSFLGDHEVNDTVGSILEVAAKEGVSPVLKFIPEHAIHSLDTSLFSAKPDRDHFDYIYSLEELALLKGVKFQSKRGFIHRFLRAYPNFEIKKIDLGDEAIQKMIFELNHIWTHNKLASGKNPKSSGENLALERFFMNEKNFNLVAFGLFLDGEMVGFTIDELLAGTDYVLSHFIKGDISIIGVYMFLMHQSCIDFIESGKKLFNYEQDLGLPGLRKAKVSWRPSTFLKKYEISRL